MSISWVHENKKEFLSWINETFAEYKFTNKIPPSFTWHSIEKNKEFIPNFTKKILKQVSTIF